MEDYIAEYLEHLGMGNDYQNAGITCEICGSDSKTVVRENITLGMGKIGKLPVVACDRCGFLFQTPRFEKRFYDDYYSRFYRDVVAGSSSPKQEFVDDQISRGNILYKTVETFFDAPGEMLDAGASVGGMMQAFKDHGWGTYGTDPDEGYVAHGQSLGYAVEAIGAEDMVLEDEKYDYIMIMGSLEHAYDPNKTLEICRKATKPEGILLLEGRGHPQGHSSVYFNHNHHRYFSLTSIELMMIKHGWKPFMTTDNPICGPTRPGGIYCFGRACAVPSHDEFLSIIDNGKREDPKGIIARFDELDARMQK